MPQLEKGQGRKLAWAGLLIGGVQAGIQVLGFIGGIIVIRVLSAEEYAYYTIANTALGMMTVLADSGIGYGVLAQGGAVWQDRMKLGAVLATGLELRRKLAILALLVSPPLVSVLLHHQGARWTEALWVAGSILPLFLATITGQLLEAVPRLHQHIFPLQRIQIGSNLGRVAILTMVLLKWPSAAVATLTAAVPQAWANWRLRRLADKYADWRVPANEEIRACLVSQIRRTMPAAIYYALSGQLTIWLISLFGHPGAVAAVGALGRLAMILNVVSVIFSTLAVPRFARISSADRGRVTRRYWQTQMAVAAVCAVALLALAGFPGPALAILGPNYTGLEHEALLMAGSSAAAIMAGAAFSLGAARGIVVPPLVALPWCILTQIILVAVLPVDSVSGVIWIGLLGTVSQWLVHIAYFQWVGSRSA